MSRTSSGSRSPGVPQSADNGQSEDISETSSGAGHVLWTRGTQCKTLAEALADGGALQAGSDLATACVAARASLLVAKHLTSFDGCNVAVPHGFQPETTRAVVAAVGGGPHSLLAALVADRLGERFSIPARAVYGYRESGGARLAGDVLAGVTSRLPDLDVGTIQAPDPATMVETLPAGTLLVVGAPGGSWFQRQFFGPGARIRGKAPNGTIVVRSTPTRVYQVMDLPTAFGPHMRAGDAALLSGGDHVIVAEEGRLLGVVPKSRLDGARNDLELRDIMETPLFLDATEEVASAMDLIDHYNGEPVPVVDSEAQLVGSVSAANLGGHPLL